MNLFLVPTLAGLGEVAQGFVYALFIVSALLLIVIILLQEGKGGGLGSAFGGAAADTFGVKAGTVNRFTTYLAACFLGLALLYAGLSSAGEKRSLDVTEPSVGAPSDETAGDLLEGAESESAPAGDPAGESPPDEDAPGSGAEVPPGDAPSDPPPGETPGDSGSGGEEER